jgi:hypothetical protein
MTTYIDVSYIETSAKTSPRPKYRKPLVRYQLDDGESKDKQNKQN